MAKKTAANQLSDIVKRIDASLTDATNRKQMRALAIEAIKLIQKRTRLGYGVKQNFGKREVLDELSPKYFNQRKRMQLSSRTTPRKSNLTRTGHMLFSMGIIEEKKGEIVIGPTGSNEDGISNLSVAEYQEGQGRTFNRISLNEFNQLRRLYRKNFGDLLKKRKLLKS